MTTKALGIFLMGGWSYAGFLARPTVVPPAPPVPPATAPAPPPPPRPAPPRLATWYDPPSKKWRGVGLRSGDTFEHADRPTLEAFLINH